MKEFVKYAFFFLMFVLNLSCFRQMGYVSSRQLLRCGEKLAHKEKRYYIIKNNGDTIESTAKYTKYLNLKPHGDIIEYQGKYDHGKYYDGKWLILAKKGRLNFYFSLVPNGSHSVADYNSRTGNTTYSTMVTHDFYFYFQKNDEEIVNILTDMQAFKNAISDNRRCLEIFNSIKRRENGELKADQYQKILDIFDVYNS